MKSYVSGSGNTTGAAAYEIGRDYIVIEFHDKVKYKYTYGSAGSGSIEAMKQFALKQNGLNTYIEQNKPAFASKS